mgnify:CR=1 FL=1
MDEQKEPSPAQLKAWAAYVRRSKKKGFFYKGPAEREIDSEVRETYRRIARANAPAPRCECEDETWL